MDVPVIVDEAEADHRIVLPVSAQLHHLLAESLQLDAFRLAQPVGVSVTIPGLTGAVTQFPNVPRLIPRLRATSVIERPEVSTSSTASRWNSGGYFAGRPIRASLLWNNVQNQVSTDRGQLQVPTFCAR
jgi:hypothetical protein